MNGTSNPSALRRRLWPRRNESLRPADWAEAALLLAVVTVAVVLLPIALAVGSETYASQTRMGQEQSRTRQPATATLVRDAPPTSVGTRGQAVISVAEVPARWTLPDGTERTGKVLADHGAKFGSPVPIWLDEAGNPVAEPVTHEVAATAGVTVALGMWGLAATALCLIFLLARVALNRSRSAAWQREWARVEPDWTRKG